MKILGFEINFGKKKNMTQIEVKPEEASKQISKAEQEARKYVISVGVSNPGFDAITKEIREFWSILYEAGFFQDIVDSSGRFVGTKEYAELSKTFEKIKRIKIRTDNLKEYVDTVFKRTSYFERIVQKLDPEFTFLKIDEKRINELIKKIEFGNEQIHIASEKFFAEKELPFEKIKERCVVMRYQQKEIVEAFNEITNEFRRVIQEIVSKIVPLATPSPELEEKVSEYIKNDKEVSLSLEEAKFYDDRKTILAQIDLIINGGKYSWPKAVASKKMIGLNNTGKVSEAVKHYAKNDRSYIEEQLAKQEKEKKQDVNKAA